MFELVCAIFLIATLWLFVIHRNSPSYWSLPKADQLWSILCAASIVGCILYLLAPFWELFRWYLALWF